MPRDPQGPPKGSPRVPRGTPSDPPSRLGGTQGAFGRPFRRPIRLRDQLFIQKLHRKTVFKTIPKENARSDKSGDPSVVACWCRLLIVHRESFKNGSSSVAFSSPWLLCAAVRPKGLVNIEVCIFVVFFGFLSHAAVIFSTSALPSPRIGCLQATLLRSCHPNGTHQAPSGTACIDGHAERSRPCTLACPSVF